MGNRMTTRIAQLSVMVVEDHSFQRSIALRLLAGLGIERAFEAANGREALERMLAAGANSRT